MSDPESLPWSPPEAGVLAAEFPKLELLSLLAQGGMSAVYLARQTDLARMAVLKVLPLEVGADAEAAERFRTEARALASVRDRGVVEVYDFGCTPGGYLYLLLEYEGGGDLRRWLHENGTGLTPAEVLGIGESIAAGLAAAHRKGIIHGDIKPDNIFVDEEGRLKVGDFGLAGFNGTGTAVYHTPGYTAPEILAGWLTMTPQSDLYALGATLFELLLQTLPPEDPASRAALLQELPRPVADVLALALQEDPAQRPASAQDYRQALEAARHDLTSTPAAAAGGSTARPVRVLNLPAAGGRPRAAFPGRKNGPLLARAGIALASLAGWLMLGKDEKTAPSPPAPAAPPAPELVVAVPPEPQVAAPVTTPEEIAIASADPPVPDPSSTEAEPAPGSFDNWLAKDTDEANTGNMAVTPPPSPPAPATTEADLAAWDPDWKIDAPRSPEPSGARLEEDAMEGRKVLILSPFSAIKPATLTRTLSLPADQAMQLSARVASVPRPGADWVMTALANGQPLGPTQIITDMPGVRFSTLAWDLSAWRGKSITLTLQNSGGGRQPWQDESSSWAWVKVEPLPDFPAVGDSGVAEASREPVEPGFVDLFSAVQLPKWKEAGAGGLAFKDGIATTFTRPGPLNEGLYWYSGRVFSDFVLKVEFKLETPMANSGLWLRFPNPGTDYTNANRGGGLEIDLLGYDIRNIGTGSIAWTKKPASLPIRQDDWNQYEIRAEGSQYSLWLNGQLINEYSGGGNRSGFLGIQHLRSYGEVKYRRLWIKDLANPTAVATSGKPSPATSTPKRPLGVPADAVAFGGKWFRFYDDKMLWLIAKKKCEDLKGHLAIVPDEATWEFVKKLAGARCCWLGATDEKSEGNWSWVDGSPVKYEKWIKGEPSNLGGKQNYLAIRQTIGWDDLTNDGKSGGIYDVKGFVCEWD